MNPGAIYSKSGKGVQEASGKTSLLKRADRAVLSAIDGRATLGEVAQKVGKPFDGAFQALIAQLDKDGFVREVSGGAAGAAPAAARPAAKPAAAPPKPAAKAPPAAGADLDFTGIMTSPVKPPPKPAFDPGTTQRLQEEALYKARQEAEARAQEQRDRLRTEAEAKARAEAETKLRAETEKRLREEAEAKAKAEAEAKARAAREAAARVAAEAKAKIEAEARAKIEAERRAREEAERKAKEEAERARREAEELRQRLEEERKAREEAERRAREEAERKEAERRAREEAERKAREEAERLEAERRAREEAERKAREEAERRARAEAEAKARAEAEAKARAEAEAKARAEAEVQMRRAREEADRRRAEAERREAETRKPEPLPDLTPPAPPPAPKTPAAGGGGLDALMADLDSFTQRDDEDRKAREDAESRTREEKKRLLREESERREREQAERERQEAEDRRREEEERRAEERRALAEEEQRAREEAEREREEAEERERRAREALAAKEAAGSDDIGVTDADLDMDDVRRDEAAVAKESRKARREREREQKRLEKEARERARESAKSAARAKAKDEPLEDVKVKKVRRRRNWGRPVAIGLFMVLAAGLAVLHVMPVPTQDYERMASAALGQPVRIGSARLSLVTGVQLNLADVTIGSGTRIAAVRAHPEIGSLFGEDKAFSRVELDGVTLRQDALGEALFARAGAQNFKLSRIVVKNLRLEGPLPVPPLEADARLANDGSVRLVDLRGPENLLGQLLPKGDAIDFNLTASTITLPFAPDIEMTSFAMKGRATRQAIRIDAWGGTVLGGALSGTANLRWSGNWQLDGAVTARGINAAAFAPALLSEGYAEGSGKFLMTGADPAKLVRAGRVEGSFTIGKGVLGSFDLARAIRTDGREVEGSTRFVELNGQGTYDRGAVALRNVVIGAGALQAGASADISQSGALSGRIVADVRTPSQSLRATLLLGGTVKEPRVRN